MTEQPLRRPTVAIVGSHPKTRTEFDFSRTDCDVWVFNEALGSPTEEWCQRADAVFQIHKPVVWRSITNRNHAGHYEWLQRHDTPTIIMQEVYPEVPNSERYPIEDVLALSPGFSYLTSSVAYAIALAILYGYSKIEIYGAEMETNTEYGHQRQGMAFWIGIAVGRGIEVKHVSPTFWSAPLYAYDGDVRIDISHYEKRIEVLTKKREELQEAHNDLVAKINAIIKTWVKDYKTDQEQLDGLVVACGQSAVDFGMVDGAIQANEQYLERCKIMLGESGTYLIVRQELEGKVYAGRKEQEEQFRRVHVKADQLHKKRLRLRTNANMEQRAVLATQFNDHLVDYIKLCTMTGIGGGVMQENMALLQMYDQKITGQVELQPLPAKQNTNDDDDDMALDIATMEEELEILSNHR